MQSTQSVSVTVPSTSSSVKKSGIGGTFGVKGPHSGRATSGAHNSVTASTLCNPQVLTDMERIEPGAAPSLVHKVFQAFEGREDAPGLAVLSTVPGSIQEGIQSSPNMLIGSHAPPGCEVSVDLGQGASSVPAVEGTKKRPLPIARPQTASPSRSNLTVPPHKRISYGNSMIVVPGDIAMDEGSYDSFYEYGKRSFLSLVDQQAIALMQVNPTNPSNPKPSGTLDSFVASLALVDDSKGEFMRANGKEKLLNEWPFVDDLEQWGGEEDFDGEDDFGGEVLLAQLMKAGRPSYSTRSSSKIKSGVKVGPKSGYR